MTDAPQTPPILDVIADKVLRYHPQEKGQNGQNGQSARKARKEKAQEKGQDAR